MSVRWSDKRRLGELDAALLQRGPQDHLPTDADGGRLGPGDQGRHLDPQVLVAWARQASRQPARSSSGVNARGSSRDTAHLALDHLHLALAAGAVAAAGGVDRDAVPAGRVEQGRPGRHPDLTGLGPRRGRNARGRRSGVGSGRHVRRLLRGGLLRCGARHGRGRSRPCPTRRCPAAGRAALTASTICGDRTSMIALVSPHLMAIGRNVAPSACRPGMPNETLDAPRVMLSASSSWISGWSQGLLRRAWCRRRSASPAGRSRCPPAGSRTPPWRCRRSCG